MGREFAFAFMNRKSISSPFPRWSVATLLAVLVGVLHVSHAAAAAPANTNIQSAALETLVADVLEHNPELNVYSAEIAAAKGERRTAAAWANPEELQKQYLLELRI